MQRTALITGGNRGIGREVCRQLAHQGLRVVLTSRTQTEGEEAARNLLSDDSAEILALPLDVADPASIGTCVEELRRRELH